MSDLLIKNKCTTVQLRWKNMLLKIGLVLYQCFWRVLMSILCVVVHVLCAYASKLLFGFLGPGLSFFGEDRLATLLCSLTRFDLANRGVRQPVQPHTHARLLVIDETFAQPHFAVVNCSDAGIIVLYSPFSTRSQTFAVINSCVIALSLFSSDILTCIQCNDK